MTPIDTFAREGPPALGQLPDPLIEPLGYPRPLNAAAALLDGTTDAGHGGAVAVLRDSEALTHDGLRAKVDHVRAQRAPYRCPRATELADEVPCTETGKLRRYAVRESRS